MKLIIKILFYVVLIGLCNECFCEPSKIDEGDKKIEPKISIRLLGPMADSEEAGKMYEPVKYKPSIIVLHFAVATTVGQIENTYYNKGLSTHCVIDKDGDVTRLVDDENMSYSACPAFWDGKYCVSAYAKSINSVNTGDQVNSLKWKEPRSVPQEADGKNWESWPEVQIQSFAWVIKSWVGEYGIKPWNIISYADCACKTLVSLGPVFPWKRLHDEYGIGFWPEEDPTITADMVNGLKLKYEDYVWFLHAFGYPKKGFEDSVENIEDLKELWSEGKFESRMANMKKLSKERTDRATITAFQYHYMQDRLAGDKEYRSGALDADTEVVILKYAKSILKKVGEEDYTLRKLQELYTTNKFSKNAKQLIKEFAVNTKLILPEDEQKSDL